MRSVFCFPLSTSHFKRMTGLYIHIPFCQARCHYCDFATYAGLNDRIPRYLAALAREMESFGGRRLETLFVGGGTPTVLEPDQWRGLMAGVRRNFGFAPGHEATVECNPESATPEKLSALGEQGINRLSFGLQAVQDFLLKRLGRLHDFAGFRRAHAAARAAGFRNINADLMYGLPGQSPAHWRETLRRVLDLGLEHVSAYALAVEEETVFRRQGIEADPDLQADMYEEASEILTRAGYVHYEISNFARPGFECRHNLRYWKNLPCLGAGLSAASYDGRTRRKNTEDLDLYLRAVEEGRSPVEEEAVLSDTERVGEDLMLSLRLKEGVRPSSRARELYGPVLDRFRSLGFLVSDPAGARFEPTLRGWRLSNRLFQELLSPA